MMILLGLLAWAICYGITGWNALSGVKISPAGWVFMVLGIIATFVVGVGLMTLVFSSSRHGMDRWQSTPFQIGASIAQIIEIMTVRAGAPETGPS